MPEIRRVWDENFQVYGAEKVWRQLNREAHPGGPLHGGAPDARAGPAGRGAGQGLQDDDTGRCGGAARRPGAAAVPGRPPEPAVGGGLYLRRDLGGLGLRGLRHRCLRPPHRRLAGGELDAHGPGAGCAGAGTVVADRDRRAGASQRPRQPVPVDPLHRAPGRGRHRSSVGSVGDSYDNALAETIIGLFKTEVIRRRGPWRTIDAVEYATLEWVDWFNHRRLLEPIGNIPPAELEQAYYRQLEESAMAA